jgi:glycosyltransferase involved in cell wall biosynthesis
MRIALATSILYHSVSELHGKDHWIAGGAESLMYHLCKFLQDEGHEPVVYQSIGDTYVDSEGNTKQTPQITKNWYGIPVVCLPVAGGWQYTTNPTYNTIFNETAADADLRIMFATFLCYPRVVSPCISISHGIFYDYIENPYKTMTEAERREFMTRQLYGFTAPDLCISVDSNVRKVLAAIEPGIESNVKIIYNYCDTEQFHPVDRPKGFFLGDKPRILYPRRLTMIRGCNEFIRSSHDLPDYDFYAVGQCHDESLGAQVKAWGETTPNLRFTERPMELMHEIYQASDIAVVPTKAAEGLSLSLLEAMACGLPIITTPVGGLGDAVIPNYNGLIYDPNHDNLSDFVEELASNPSLCRKFGDRNRQIACESFDISIWHRKWREVINQFEHHPKVVKRREFEERHKPKLVAMMLTHNETGRYLERVVKNTLSFADELVILDDHSDDITELLHLTDRLQLTRGNRIFVKRADASWSNECALRVELFQFALTRNPDWCISVDADELFEPRLADHVQEYMKSRYNWIAFRFFDMWNDEDHYRDDEYFPAGSYGPRMFRVKGLNAFEWLDKRRHCGSTPANILELVGRKSDVRVKHLGYLECLTAKQEAKMEDDPDNEFYSAETYEAITLWNPDSILPWSDVNLWPTKKLTIGYPPGMEWATMQQRPHHLLKLMAEDGNRVFFADDTAPYTCEVEPNLTVIRDWSEVKQVDVLYVTSPVQMDYCKELKYDTLIYDCCDWQYSADQELIKTADVVLVASRRLYLMIQETFKEKVKNLVYLPNACDFDHFSQSTAVPTEDIVGYSGVCSDVLDGNIINALAENHKLVFAGQNKGMKTGGNENVKLIGHVPYSQLPEVMAQFKVGIIPFRTDNPYTLYSSPIKVYEFLAAGLPVVASPLLELKPLADKGLIRIVPNDDLEGWIKAVDDALAEYPNRPGVEFARINTWADRYEQLKGVLKWQ